MIQSSSDFRLLLFTLGEEGAQLTGQCLSEIWSRVSRSGRLRRELGVLEKLGVIGRQGEGLLDERLYSVTELGRRARDGVVDPERLWSRSWDGRWRMVLFDVPEARSHLRTKLRRVLQKLRFGWLQNSVWISPDPVTELTAKFGENRITVESLILLEARPAGGESDSELVAGAWDFDRVEKAYASYVKVLRLQPGMKSNVRLSAWAAWLQAERKAWDQVCRHDPFLPASLLPPGYAGRDAWRARRVALETARSALRSSLGLS